MRKITSIAAALTLLAMLAVSAVTASASSPCTPNPDGTSTCTMNLHDATLVVGPPNPPCVPPLAAGTITNINAVFHLTVNKAGDAWATGTIEGDATVTDPSSGVTYTGHVSQWFGAEANNRNFVQHETLNGNLTGSDGSTLAIHVSLGFGISASGQPIMHMNFSC